LAVNKLAFIASRAACGRQQLEPSLNVPGGHGRLHPALAGDAAHRLVLVQTVYDRLTNPAVASPQHRPIKELQAESAAAPLPIYAEGKFGEIVARPHDVRGSHDIEVIIEQRPDVIGTQIDALHVLAGAGLTDRKNRNAYGRPIVLDPAGVVIVLAGGGDDRGSDAPEQLSPSPGG
jgi:hypothetical protein